MVCDSGLAELDFIPTLTQAHGGCGGSQSPSCSHDPKTVIVGKFTGSTGCKSLLQNGPYVKLFSIKNSFSRTTCCPWQLVYSNNLSSVVSGPVVTVKQLHGGSGGTKHAFDWQFDASLVLISAPMNIPAKPAGPATTKLTLFAGVPHGPVMLTAYTPLLNPALTK